MGLAHMRSSGNLDKPLDHTSVNEGFWTNFLRFNVKVDPVPEVVSPFALGNLDFSTSPLCLTVLPRLRQSMEVRKNFTIFYVDVNANSDPEVHDFIELFRRLAAVVFRPF